VLAPQAMADALSPESGGSPNANDIDTLYKIVFAFGVLVFLGVEGTLILFLVKYRKRRGGPPPEQIRGNTALEIGWTAGAAVLLVIITVVMFAYLGGIKNPRSSLAGGLQFASLGQPPPPGGKSLEIGVNGQQYLWRYDYPGEDSVFNYYEMVVPIKTTVTLEITSQDVQHSWWIPKLGGKHDAVPGHTNETWFRIDKPGSYVGECAELCGEGHATHYARVRAVEPAEYELWVTRQAELIKDSQEELAASRREREGEANEAPDAPGGEDSELPGAQGES